MPSRHVTPPNRGEVTVTRQVHFNAAHRLYNRTKSAAWNKETYGPCANASGHGHNYVMELSVRGRPNPQTGFLIDLGLLRRIAEDAVANKVDHKHLNKDVPFLKGVIPTTENLVMTFWEQIARLIPTGCRLVCLRLYETPRNFAEYHGPGGGDLR